MNPQWDVIVVGAGPAGSTLARTVAAAGYSVLMLEKDRDIGMPVRCGEAVSDTSLRELVDVDPRWIASTIRRFRLIAPDGNMVEPDLGGHGYVLERRIFDYDLARLASEAGAVVRTKSYVEALIPGEDGFAGVRIQGNNGATIERARIIVGADGVESRVGRWAGLRTETRLRDMECCAQMTLSNIPVEDDACDFYFGQSVAPMGYLWVFPKGRNTANVGLGISGMAAKKRSPLSYLRDFVTRTYPQAGILTTVAGGVPCAPTLESVVTRNVVLVGDAAHQVNPVSGGGITSGMRAARLAGEAVIAALRENLLQRLGDYQRQWDKGYGAKHRMYYRIKEAVHGYSDEALNRIAAGVLALKPEKRTIWGVFRVALTRNPALIWDMVRVFGLTSFDDDA